MFDCGQDRPGRYGSLIKPEAPKPPRAEEYKPLAEMAEGELFDAQSYATMELDTLYELLNTCRTDLGRAALQRAIAHPPLDGDDVRARQAALNDLTNNDALKSSAEALVTEFSLHEPGLMELMWSKFTGIMSNDTHDEWARGGYGYKQFKRSRKALKAMEDFGVAASSQEAAQSVVNDGAASAEGGNATPEKSVTVKSGFFQGLVDDFTALKSSRAAELLRGPAYVTETSPITKSEKAWYRPAYRFRPTVFKPLLLLFLIAVPVGLNFIFNKFYTGSYYDGGNNVYPIMGLLIIFGIIPIVLSYIVMIGGHERDRMIKPTGGELRKDPKVQTALDALGELDVLLAHLRFKADFPSQTVLPEIFDGDHHVFSASGLKGPIIAMQEADYIANDVAFDAARLSFITGPNSGGKTALSKAVCQNQVLGQMGGFVTAQSARLTPAGLIAYQVPQAGDLNQREGRFATELGRTRDIFFASKANALVVLDEPFEGTSSQERLETSEQVLDGFVRLKASVLFITHNHALAALYRDRGGEGAGGEIFQFLEASFENDYPTHKFKHGIASTSHAARIANEIGFGQEDIQRRFEGEEK